MATDKAEMERYYNYALDSLYSAYENLRNAKNILDSDLIFDDGGFYTKEISEKMEIIEKCRKEIIDIVLPAIRDLE